MSFSLSSHWLSTGLHAAAEYLAASLPFCAALGLAQLAGLALLIFLLVRHFQMTEQRSRLKDAANAVAQGDRQARCDATDGPLAELTQDFNDMVTLLGNEIRSLRATQRELEQLVATDRLTGVGNRRQFEQQAEAESARSKRYGIPASLILFDVDHFKRINDEFGHQVGDSVLVNLTRRVAHRLRDTDCIARWGGEEFAVLTPCTPISGAEVLAEKIRRIVADEDFEVVGRVTISLGVAQMRKDEPASRWIARADEFLYEAKNAGRNRVSTADNTEEQSTPFVLIWGEQFLVRHSAIDAEHAEIFRLANELVLAHHQGSKAAELARFDTLIESIEQHFSSEETILHELGCPDAECASHTQLHRGLLAQCSDLRRRFEVESIDIFDVGDFIVRRIAIGHMVNVDLPLFASLVNSATIAVSDETRPSLRVRIQRAIF